MMTREEAIAVLVESKRQNEVMRDNPSTFWSSRQMADGVKNAERRIATLDMALTALRPVSREQVVKVRGTWDENKSATIDSVVCSNCGTVFQSYYENYQFCPRCGQPKTDEAVDMMLEKWKEAVENA